MFTWLRSNVVQVYLKLLLSVRFLESRGPLFEKEHKSIKTSLVVYLALSSFKEHLFHISDTKKQLNDHANYAQAKMVHKTVQKA